MASGLVRETDTPLCQLAPTTTRGVLHRGSFLSRPALAGEIHRVDHVPHDALLLELPDQLGIGRWVEVGTGQQLAKTQQVFRLVQGRGSSSASAARFAKRTTTLKAPEG